MLDTNVFIHFERSGNPIDFSKWEKYGGVYISAITSSELTENTKEFERVPGLETISFTRHSGKTA